MVGSSSAVAVDDNLKPLERRMTVAMVIKSSNKVKPITMLITTALFGLTLRIHGGENVDLVLKQMKCLFGSDELKPQKPLFK